MPIMSGADWQSSLPDPGHAPDDYQRALIAAAGDRDPIAVLAQSPTLVREIIGDPEAPALWQRPASGEWCAAEIVGHLLDDESINSFRLRLTLTDPGHEYPGTEPDRWATLGKPAVTELLAAWMALRQYHMSLVRSLTEEQLALEGMHAEQGPESVRVQLLKNAGHDLVHIDQLHRTLAVVQAT